MATLYTIGGGGDFATITAALASGSVVPGDWLAFLSGYNTETATVGIENLTFSGDGSNTGIALTLSTGIMAIALTGSAPISITGNDGSNTLLGGDGNQSINGGGGADTLAGNEGNDNINGGAGALCLCELVNPRTSTRTDRRIQTGKTGSWQLCASAASYSGKSPGNLQACHGICG